MDYEVIARLGRGGMGVVDLARDLQGQEVALKRLTLKGSANEIARAHQRFSREASVLSRLHHPNIVRLIEVVEDGDEMVLVMPYLSGGSLADRVAQHGPAPPPDVEQLGERLLGALAAAHQAGIIHRDLKPANVLYDSVGEPMLADFGLAHTWDQTHGLTVAGMVVGTPGYMPPEQARDEPLTPATDIFSLGATLLFAATGHGPYGSGDPGLLMVRAANGEVQPVPRHLPKGMRGWLASMLDPDPEYRPTAVALLTGHGLPPRRLTGWRRPRNLVAASAAAVAVFALVAVGLGDRSPDEDQIDGGAGAVEPPDDPGSPLTVPGEGPQTPSPDDSVTGGTVDPPGDEPVTDSSLPDDFAEGDAELEGHILDAGEPEPGEFSRANESVVFLLPPALTGAEPGDPECENEIRLTLQFTGEVGGAEIRVLNDGEELGSEVATPDDRVEIPIAQDLCDEEEFLWAEVRSAGGAEGNLGGFVISREDFF